MGEVKMTFVRRGFAAALGLTLVLCSGGHVTKERWEKMSRAEKDLYVTSMLGAEKAKAAKGGKQKKYTQTADNYVARIDAAYQRRDSRAPDVIFAGLADRR